MNHSSWAVGGGEARHRMTGKAADELMIRQVYFSSAICAIAMGQSRPISSNSIHFLHFAPYITNLGRGFVDVLHTIEIFIYRIMLIITKYP